MKQGQEANAQYYELANALRQIGIEWVVAEVEEILSRGKEVPFRDLTQDQQVLYERRLDEEARKGFHVGRAKPSDTIGVPYRPDERLALLVAATKRIINTSAHSQVYVAEFATRHNINDVILEQPVGADTAAASPARSEIPMAVPSHMDERLDALGVFLDENVLD